MERIMKKWIILFSLLMGLSSLSFGANMQSLDKEKVNKLFSDHTLTTISTVTLNGKMAKNTFTGFFGKDGKMIGQLASKPDTMPQGDKGVWKVKDNGQLCVTWEHWESAKEVCMDIYQTKNMLIFINAGTGKFESAALMEHFKEGDQMN